MIGDSCEHFAFELLNMHEDGRGYCSEFCWLSIEDNLQKWTGSAIAIEEDLSTRNHLGCATVSRWLSNQCFISSANFC